ncbi:hypothetical protein NQ317_005943 [Molorchus minor]|uniref:Uncharacterized protein n=1 Tax=Molorchus minor TaxID=1323400 RepID=A0ABQ9J9F1_9CUCU|nr:hypothetical protein NQ317_005943 [Molorchus minor]
MDDYNRYLSELIHSFLLDIIIIWLQKQQQKEEAERKRKAKDSATTGNKYIVSFHEEYFNTNSNVPSAKPSAPPPSTDRFANL